MWKLVFCWSLAGLLQATIFGRIQGIVHDPQHRPVAGASVKLQAITSDYSQTTQANDNGEFSFTSVPVGDYKITVTQPKFETSEQTVTVDSNSSPVLHFPTGDRGLESNCRGRRPGRSGQHGFGDAHHSDRS